jgi:hypothetical protein
MKIQRNISRKTKIIYGVVLAIVLICSAFAAYAYVSRDKPQENKTSDEQHVDTKPPTDEQIKAGQDAKQKTVDEETNPKTPTPSDNGNTEQLAVTITAASQNYTTVSLRALISGTVSQSGNCTLIITNGTKSVTKTAATQALANSSTCQGFDMQTSELGAGTWKFQLTATIGSQSGSATKSIDVQ